MSLRDSMYDDTAVRPSLSPAARATNGSVDGTTVDMQGTRNWFRVAMLIVVAGPITDGTHTVTLQDSEDGATGWVDVPADAREGAFPALTTADSNTARRVGYLGRRRYVRARITTTGAPATTPVGGIIGAVILLRGGRGQTPVT
jgi:hypothetical protein